MWCKCNFFFKSLLHTFWPPCLQIWIYNEKALFQNFRNQQLFCAFTIFRTWHSPDRLIKTQVFLTLYSLKWSSMIDGSFHITQWSAKVYWIFLPVTLRFLALPRLLTEWPRACCQTLSSVPFCVKQKVFSHSRPTANIRKLLSDCLVLWEAVSF